MAPHLKLPRVASAASLGKGSFHGFIELDRLSIKTNTEYQKLLGCEPNHLDPSIEFERVQQVIAALTEKEQLQMSDPQMPIRHLRAEDGESELAIQKLRAALKWRNDFDVQRIRNTHNDTEMQELIARENGTGKIYVRGYDKQGRAFVYMRPARENCNHNLQGNMIHLVWNMEKAIACTRKRSIELGSPLPLEKIILIIDYEGFRLRDSPPLATTKYTLDILQKHYPERMHRAYVVHPPLVFSSFWALIKNFIDPTTKEKIVFCNKKTIHKLQDVSESISKLELFSGGDGSAREFNSTEYVNLPFDVCFDE